MTHNVRSDSNHQFFSDKRVDDQVINPLRFVPLTAETKTLVLQKLRQRIKCDGNLVFDEDQQLPLAALPRLLGPGARSGQVLLLAEIRNAKGLFGALEPLLVSNE